MPIGYRKSVRKKRGHPDYCTVSHLCSAMFISMVRFFKIYMTCVNSEQEQLAANQSTNLDQTVDGDTTGVTGLVPNHLGYIHIYYFHFLLHNGLHNCRLCTGKMSARLSVHMPVLCQND